MPRRRGEIAAAVAAYNMAHPVQLPRNTARLLAAMFPSGDVCQRSLADIAAGGGFSARMLPATLRRLADAGFLTRQRGGSRRIADTYQLHLPPLVRR
jgi:hypothetical protein